MFTNVPALELSLRQAFRPSRKRFFLLAIAVCLAVTLALFWRLREDARREYRSTFEHDANLRLHLVIGHLEENLSDLDSIRRFFLGSQFVDRREFAGFVRPIVARRGDIAAIAWVPRDAGPRRDPSRVTYLESRAGPADREGADLGRQPAVRTLLDAAAGAGIAAAHTTWVLPGSQTSAPVVIVAVPVIATTREAAATSAATGFLLGHLLEILSCEGILAAAIAGTDPVGLDTELFEVRDGGSQLTIDRSAGRLPGSATLAGGLHKSRDFTFAGRSWQVDVTDTQPYLQRHLPKYHTWVLPLGLLLTAVLALYLRGLITRQRRIEQEVQARTDELREREEHLRAIQETAPLAIVVWDLERRVTEWNPAAAALFGWKREEVLGRDFFTFLIPDDQSLQVEQVVQLLLQGRLPADSLNENLTRDGRRILCQWHNAVQRDALGKAVGVTSIGADVTERLRAQAERERLLEELAVANRELEGIIRATSHDLRSPLVSLLGFARRIEKNCGVLRELLSSGANADELRRSLAPALQQRIPAALGCILASGDKMERLIASLTRLSRTRCAVLHPQPLDVRDMLRSITVGMAYQIQEAAAVVEFGELPRLQADPDLMSQVFSNLLDNALKYRDPARALLIKIEGQTGAGWVRYTVGDNGRGIPPERQEKIWELFSRLDTTEAIPGEGVGLTIVRRIIERHEGKIRVESEPGQGSRFILEIPDRVAA